MRCHGPITSAQPEIIIWLVILELYSDIAVFYCQVITVESKVYTAKIIVDGAVSISRAERFFKECFRGVILSGLKKPDGLLDVTIHLSSDRKHQK
ncbi:MAG TPA: hypothetical protein VIH59_26645 [Candidatus Tectomicrobia bacterium]